MDDSLYDHSVFAVAPARCTLHEFLHIISTNSLEYNSYSPTLIIDAFCFGRRPCCYCHILVRVLGSHWKRRCRERRWSALLVQSYLFNSLSLLHLSQRRRKHTPRNLRSQRKQQRRRVKRSRRQQTPRRLLLRKTRRMPRRPKPQPKQSRRGRRKMVCRYMILLLHETLEDNAIECDTMMHHWRAFR